MHRSWLRRSFGIPTALVLTLFAAKAASAQVVFSGRVSGGNGQPLAGASVTVTELGVGGIAAVDGKYLFTVADARVRGRTVTVSARIIGYKPKALSVTVTGGRVDHDFVLDRDVLQLEEVVTTGTSAATELKKTPFTVAVIDNTQIKDAPAVSPLGSLAGKIPGASTVSTSGQPGAEPSIRLRSATSLTGRQDPLIIVDGTIFTKRGTSLGEGQTSFSLRSELGQSTLPRVLYGNMHHNYRDSLNASGQVVGFLHDANGNRIPNDDNIAENAYPVVYDQLRQVFKPGSFMTNYVSVGKRQGTTNLNASFQNTRDAGVLESLKGFQRQNFRLNVDQALTPKVDLGMGAFYGRSTSDQGEDVSNVFFGLRFLEPNVKLDSIPTSGPFKGMFNPAIKQPPLSGNVGNPLYNLSQNKVNQDRDRFTGTFRSAYRPMDWVTFEGNVGYDESGQTYKNFRPLGFANSAGAQSKGGLFAQDNADRSYNIGLTGTGNQTWDVGMLGPVHNTTKVAYLYEDQTNSHISVNAPALTVPNVTEFTAAAQDPNNPVTPGSRTETIRARDVFLVSTFDIKDRYILDGLIRRDESSLFGAQARSQTYHRVSGAYRVSQDLHLPAVDELKLRVSHGTAGLRPPFSAQFEVFAVQAGAPEKITLGNSKLKPAFSAETEAGIDLNFLTRFSFEYTYSKKRTTDEIIKVPLSAATGYQNQWQNAGTLEGSTHEAGLGIVLASKADYFWKVNLTADRTRTTITDLSVGPFLIGPSEGTTNTQIFRIAKGQPLGVIYGTKWIKTADQLAETIKTGQLGGAVTDYTLNEEGYYVKNSQFHTNAEVPLKAFTCDNAACATGHSVIQIGNVNPDFNSGLTTNATYKSLQLSGTLTWVKGGNIYNYTRQWPFNELRDPVEDQSGKPSPGVCPLVAVDPNCPYKTGRKTTNYYSAFYNNFDPNDYFVEDGSYWRLRELAVNWELPQKWVSLLPAGDFHGARLGIVGRNLWTHTKYSGYDPDVTGPGGGNPFSYRVDYFTYPAYRTFTGMLELRF